MNNEPAGARMERKGKVEKKMKAREGQKLILGKKMEKT